MGEGVSVCQQNVFASCDEVMNESLSQGLSSGSCASKGVGAECKDKSVKIDGDCSETTKTEVDISFYVTEAKYCTNNSDSSSSESSSSSSESASSDSSDSQAAAQFAVEALPEDPISLPLYGFAAIGLGFLLYGAHQHFFGKKSEEFIPINAEMA